MSDYELDQFESFPKLARLYKPCVITEKIDGTNAQITVTTDGRVLAGSRNRWITPDKDNHGFATWVLLHEDELRSGLGIGRHYGEWWGPGIQRGYGVAEKRFSLFNAARWGDDAVRPACCHVVPVIEVVERFNTDAVETALRHLKINGSLASPGFMRPEGVVVYHAAGNVLFKATLENDEGKWIV